MPNVDQCESAIINALSKAGWQVVKKHLALRTGTARRYVYADLLLKDLRTQSQTIVVEVKCFPSPKTVIEEFYRAYGQYEAYRRALQKNKVNAPLYLAIPAPAYNTLMRDILIREMIEDAAIKRIIVDIKIEEILEWID